MMRDGFSSFMPQFFRMAGTHMCCRSGHSRCILARCHDSQSDRSYPQGTASNVRTLSIGRWSPHYRKQETFPLLLDHAAPPDISLLRGGLAGAR